MRGPESSVDYDCPRRANSTEGGASEIIGNFPSGWAPGRPDVSMSYNFAVWEGPSPLSNAHGSSDFERYIAERAEAAASTLIDEFITRLDGEREQGTDDELWVMPLRNLTTGPFLYFGAADGREVEAGALVAAAAAELGVVAFDPQARTLIPSAVTMSRATAFQLPPPSEAALHVAAVIDEALGAPSAMAGIIEHIESAYYVQWMTRDGKLLVEAQGDAGLDEEHKLTAEAKVGLAGLGFTESSPNWSVNWEDGKSSVDEAAGLVARVFAEVRALPPGTSMELQTFPV